MVARRMWDGFLQPPVNKELAAVSVLHPGIRAKRCTAKDFRRDSHTLRATL